MRRAFIPALVIASVAAACGDDDSATRVPPPPTTAVTSTGAPPTAPPTTAPPDTVVSPTTTAVTTAPTTTSPPEGSKLAETDRDGCPDGNFLLDEVNGHEATGGNPDPQLAVRCDGGTLVIETNGVINYEFVSVTPNGLAAQDLVFEIPLQPTVRAVPGAVPLGTIGVTVTGVSIFGAFEAPNDGYLDPVLDGLLDFCDGHTAQGGWYHYHGRWDCIFEVTDLVGLVYGYALDGYEMVSPYACANDACTEVRMVTSSYVRTDPNGLGAFEAFEYREGSGDLDECNGMTGPDGEYRYYVTEQFPYVPFCYHGETPASPGEYVPGNPPNALYVDSQTGLRGGGP